MTKTAEPTKQQLADRLTELGVEDVPDPKRAKHPDLVKLVKAAEEKAADAQAQEPPPEEPAADEAPADDVPDQGPVEPEPVTAADIAAEEPGVIDAVEPAEPPETVTKTGHERVVEKVRGGVWWCPYCDHSQRVGDFDVCQGCGAKRGS
jgi:rubrerythrin